MNQFATAREAKEFLVSRVTEEAQREGLPLSEIERKMLYFSETGWTLPDITEVNEKFDNEFDQTQYEKKITRLIRTETRRLRKENPDDFALWISAARKLKKGDHYISVMVDAAHVPTGSVSDKWKSSLLFAIFIGIFIGSGVLWSYLGLSTPRTNRSFGSYTINEKLSDIVGYLFAFLMVLYFCGLVFAHFDHKRRLYRICDRMLDPVFDGVLKLFGLDERAR